MSSGTWCMYVRKHRAPQISHVIPFFQLCTNSQKSQNFNDPTSNIKTTGRELRATFLRNHPRPAPNGELRRLNISLHNVLAVSQKAPSTKTCIKTVSRSRRRTCPCQERKHRAPKGALRQRGVGFRHHFDRRPSESTERQKVH